MIYTFAGKTILPGTTELDCLGETRVQSLTRKFFVDWAWEKHETEGETAV